MSWRILIISKPSRLSLKQAQLCIRQHDKDGAQMEYSVPMEDIAICIVESLQVTITSQCLHAFTQANIAMVSCGENHHPSGIQLPLSGHHRQSHIAQLQLGASATLKKRLWQKMVRNKILNQACCLDMHQQKGATYLRELAQNTASGDRNNCEAQAAAFYFKALLGAQFFRGRDDSINHALDYGYAIMRALMARAVVAAGLIPNLGIFHHNQLNSFNLVDDCMEILRPVVDFFVRSEMENIKNSDTYDLSLDMRQQLVALLTKEVLIQDKLQTCVSASLLYTQMLVRCFKDNSADSLPDLHLS